MKVVDAWTSFWISGQSDSFIPEGIEKPFASIWHSLAASLPEQASVLDVCCGNGAIAQSLEQTFSDNALHITGVDYADIQVKAEDFKQHKLRFVSKTDAASLPFEDASFDAAVSQFGVEYSDWTQTLKEVARVCKPDAKVCFIVHSEDSLIAKNVAAQLEALQAIAESDFFNVYAEFLSLLNESGEGNELALQIRIDEANKALASVSKKLGDKAEAMGGSPTIADLLEAASGIFEQRTSTTFEQQLKQLGAYELMNLAAIERMKNMQSVALDESRVDEFVAQLQEAGFDASKTLLSAPQGNIAYKVIGTRNG